jgi:hypothetical protein
MSDIRTRCYRKDIDGAWDNYKKTFLYSDTVAMTISIRIILNLGFVCIPLVFVSK